MTACFVLAWRDATVTLRVCEPSLAHDSARLLGLVAQAGEPQTGEPPDITVEAAAGGLCVRYRLTAHSFADPADVRMYLVTMISTAMLARTAALVLHAGAIEAAGRAVLFSGAARVGKSTLAFTAWRRGLRVVGDDWLVIEPGAMRVEAFPKSIKPRLRPEDAPPQIAARCAPADRLAGVLVGEPRLLIGRNAPGMTRLGESLPLAALVFLQRGQGATALTPLTGRDALGALMGQLMVTQARSGLAMLAPLKRLLGDGAVYRLSVGEGDTEAAVDLLVQAGAQAPPATSN